MEYAMNATLSGRYCDEVPSPDEPANHYFSAAPQSAQDERVVEVLLPDLAFVLRTDSGVFAHGKIDAGTQLLLAQETELPTEGDLLDLGCGAGVIALTLAQRSPGARVWAVDVNPRARDLCTRNAAALGLTNVEVRSPEDMPQDLRFASIWSNPPIRIGKAALHELLNRWLWRIEPDGTIWLVVSRHLGADSLQRWLTQRGAVTSRVNSKAGYRILTATVASDAWRIDGDAEPTR
jgi:16S rRNA (guanine1207-N2)-methyltransferase